MTVAHLGRCAFCGLVAIEEISLAIARRKIGEAIYCDEACRDALEGLSRKLAEALPSNVDQLLCRHRVGLVRGHCFESEKAIP